MLTRICKEAGTSVIYTNHSIRSTTIQKLAEGRLEVREIMSISQRAPYTATGHLLWITEHGGATCCVPVMETSGPWRTAPQTALWNHLLNCRDPAWTLLTAVSATVLLMPICNSISKNSPKCISTHCTSESYYYVCLCLFVCVLDFQHSFIKKCIK